MSIIQDPAAETELADASFPEVQAEELLGKRQVLVEEELLVEEISIDGMCGVY